jgi:hypothetical protein
VLVDLAAIAAVVAAHEAEQGSLQPEQLQPVLQSLVQSVDGGTASSAMSVIGHLMRSGSAQVRVQLLEQAATQLPALLAAMNRNWATSTAILQMTAAAHHSKALRQALHEHAGEAMEALQQLLDGMKQAALGQARSNGGDDDYERMDPWRFLVSDMKCSLLWLLWEPNDGHAAAAAAAAAGAAAAGFAAAPAGFARELGNELMLPTGCTLQCGHPPHNAQLLQHPALLDCICC